MRSREGQRERERFAGIYSISIRVITASLTLANGLLVSAYLTAERTRGLSCRGGWHMGTMAHAITMATSPTTDLSAISLLSSSRPFWFFPFPASLSPSFSRREVHEGCPFVCRSPPSRARTYVILLFCRRLSTSVSLSVPSGRSIESAYIALSLIGNWWDHTTMLAFMMKRCTRLSRENLSTIYSLHDQTVLIVSRKCTPRRVILRKHQSEIKQNFIMM